MKTNLKFIPQAGRPYVNGKLNCYLSSRPVLYEGQSQFYLPGRPTLHEGQCYLCLGWRPPLYKWQSEFYLRSRPALRNDNLGFTSHAGRAYVKGKTPADSI
jgi:hypothetical protein